MHIMTCVKVKGQLCGATFFLMFLREFQGPNSGRPIQFSRKNFYPVSPLAGP